MKKTYIILKELKYIYIYIYTNIRTNSNSIKPIKGNPKYTLIAMLSSNVFSNLISLFRCKRITVLNQ